MKTKTTLYSYVHVAHLEYKYETASSQGVCMGSGIHIAADYITLLLVEVPQCRHR